MTTSPRRTNGRRAAATPPRRRERELLDAATKVFHERGYANATVQDVADELGILKGSLYYYIKTKEDLLFWLLDEAHEHVEEILSSSMARNDLPPLDRLAVYVRGQVEYNVANLPRVSVYYHDMGRLGPERLREIRRRRRAHGIWVTAMIQEAQARKEVDEALDPAILANCLFGTLIWLYRWYRPGSEDVDAVIDHVTRFAMAGITGAGAVALPD